MKALGSGLRQFAPALRAEQFGNLLIFAALIIIASALSDAFFTRGNLLNVLRQISITGIIAVGMTFVIITAGIDLSVGSTVGLVTVLAAAAQPLGTLSVILIGLAVGATVGVLNGIGVAYGRIPPFIMTLATLYITRGVAFLYSGGLPQYGITEGFIRLGSGSTLGIPNPAVYFLGFLLLGGVLLRLTVFGRYVFAIGANEEAARLSGVNVELYKVLVYVLSGTLAAVGGLIYTSQLGIGVALAGQGYELNAIAAVAVGGTSFFGGHGSILGTFFGAAIIGIGNNLLNLTRVDPMLQDFVKGLIILGAVLLNRRRA
ncbi:MAG: ABC transporter permease [Acidobacteria bacterium]|nr:ABC transporter permease [Acidobacteriota bacterium]